MQDRLFGKLLFQKLFSLILLISISAGSLSAARARDEFLFVNENPAYLAQLNQTTTSDVQIPNCPDASGVLRGTARMSTADAKNPAAVTVVEAKITAYVDDSAELTYFDLSGTATENGASRTSFSVEENKINVSASTGGTTGRTMINVAPNLDAPAAERADQSARNAVKAIYEQAAAKLRAARDAWRSGACVEVKLTAPKRSLSAGEKIIVTAESLHKIEKLSIQAKLNVKEASASATPDEQRGTPQARFTLVAPEAGKKAFIVVESVSKRGIGTAKLEFEENAVVARRPPVKKTPPTTPPKKKIECSAWSGKIALVRRRQTKNSRPASGAKLRDITTTETVFNVEYALPGIQDPAGGFVNGYFADTQVSYRDAEYREEFYKSVKMGCKGGGIITTDETHNFEKVSTASGGGRTTIYVTVGGEKGILTLSSPGDIKGEQIITRKYETSCAPYNQVNSGVDHNGTVEAPIAGYEIDFELDAKSNYQLTGSKTFQDSDGSEVIVTWNLTRDCK